MVKVKKGDVTQSISVQIGTSLLLMEVTRRVVFFLAPINDVLKPLFSPLENAMGSFASKAVPYQIFNRYAFLVGSMGVLCFCAHFFNQNVLVKSFFKNWSQNFVFNKKKIFNSFYTGCALGVGVMLFQAVVALRENVVYLLGAAFSVQALFALCVYLFTYFGNDYAEELLFRGYIFDRLESRYSLHFTCFLQAFLFAIIHMGGYAVLTGWDVFLNAFLGGLALGYVRVYTGSLYGSLGFHLASNGFGNWLSRFFSVSSIKAIGLVVSIQWIWLLFAIILAYRVQQGKKVRAKRSS